MSGLTVTHTHIPVIGLVLFNVNTQQSLDSLQLVGVEVSASLVMVIEVIVITQLAFTTITLGEMFKTHNGRCVSDADTSNMRNSLLIKINK